MQGRQEMLRSIFGGDDTPPEPPKPARKFSIKLFDALFGG
jgi:hypothetical protein